MEQRSVVERRPCVAAQHRSKSIDASHAPVVVVPVPRNAFLPWLWLVKDASVPVAGHAGWLLVAAFRSR
jgi:hypothetical protein